ncbi:MAG: hypothetical protein LUG12_06095 [Erysipelotrichaceae bacterium]|nr:hypothetical protein [Erysipelotrichaceae bacterium]
MLVVLKENLLNFDIERILNIVKKYGVEVISGNCFELPDVISYQDLDTLQQDKAIDKIIVNDHYVESIKTTFGVLKDC